MLSARWDNPDELYTVIVGALRDGSPADVAEAAEHLYKIDPNRRSAGSDRTGRAVPYRRPVNAVGFATPSEISPILQDAIGSKLSGGPPAPAVAIDAHEALTGNYSRFT